MHSLTVFGLAVVVAALGFVSTGAVVAQAPPGPVGLTSTTVLQTTTTVTGQPLQFPLFRNQWTVVVLEIAPGGQVGRHMHPVPNLAYVLAGEAVLEAEGHPARTYRPGQAWSEGDHWHNAFNRGSVPLRILVVFAGEEGRPVTVRP